MFFAPFIPFDISVFMENPEGQLTIFLDIILTK